MDHIPLSYRCKRRVEIGPRNWQEALYCEDYSVPLDKLLRVRCYFEDPFRPDYFTALGSPLKCKYLQLNQAVELFCCSLQPQVAAFAGDSFLNRSRTRCYPKKIANCQSVLLRLASVDIFAIVCSIRPHHPCSGFYGAVTPQPSKGASRRILRFPRLHFLVFATGTCSYWRGMFLVGVFSPSSFLLSCSWSAAFTSHNAACHVTAGMFASSLPPISMLGRSNPLASRRGVFSFRAIDRGLPEPNTIVIPGIPTVAADTEKRHHPRFGRRRSAGVSIRT